LSVELYSVHTLDAFKPVDAHSDLRPGVRARRRGASGYVEHRLDDLAVAGAAAEDAAEGVEHHRLGRPCFARQEVACRHQHARRADAALRGAVAMKGTLQRIQLALRREPFHCGDGASADLTHGDEAG